MPLSVTPIKVECNTKQTKNTPQSFKGQSFFKEVIEDVVAYNKENSIWKIIANDIKSIFNKETLLRLPVKKVNHISYSLGSHFTQKQNLVKEYKNPEAKMLYEKAKKAATLSEKLHYYRQMGKYEIIDLNLEKKLI